MNEIIGGALFALFFLVGRWCPDRLNGNDTGGLILTAPRTLVALAILLFCTLGCLRSHRKPTEVLGPVEKNHLTRITFANLAMLLYMATTAIWSPMAAMESEKLWEVLTVAVTVGCLGVWLHNNEAQRLTWWFWVFTTALTSMMAGLGAMSMSGERLAVLGGGPNVFGRSMVLWIVGVTMLQKRWTFARRLVWPLVVTLGVALTIMSGSRGASVCLVVTLACLFWCTSRNVFAKLWCLSLAALLGAGVSLSTEFGRQVMVGFQERFLGLSIEQGYTSGRDELFLDALETGIKYPWFGLGLDGFRFVVNSEYAHNIILEVFSEGGGIGLVLLLAYLGSVAAAIWTQRKQVDELRVIAFIAVLVAGQFSGDLFDSRGIFFMSLMVIVPRARATPKPAGVLDSNQPLMSRNPTASPVARRSLAKRRLRRVTDFNATR